jgi:hypothetical protein
MESPSTLAAELPRKLWLAPPMLILAAGLVLVAIYLQFIWPGNWMSSAEPLGWKGSALNLTKGQGYKGQGTLAIEALTDQGEQSVAVAAFSPKTFRAKDYSTVSWVVTGMQPGVKLVFLWHTAENSGRLNTRPLVATKAGLAPLDMSSDADWKGQILGIALLAKGQLDAPITIQSVSIKPGSALGALAKVSDRWFTPEGWQGSSINFLDADAVDQDAPLVAAVAALVFLALALYFLLVRINFLRAHVVVAWCVVFLGWFALDARWQWNMLRQLDSTRQQYAGKSSEDKHRATDGGLFEFMQQVNAKLPADAGRVVYFSDDAYARGKGAYYLYPRNVMASNDAAVVAKLRAGDYVAVFAGKDMKYDAARQSFVWGNLKPLAGDLLMSVAGNFLLRVR